MANAVKIILTFIFEQYFKLKHKNVTDFAKI